MSLPVPPRLYTLKEAAALLSISVRTLRRRCDQGLIQEVRLGTRSPRVSADELERVMREGVSAE